MAAVKDESNCCNHKKKRSGSEGEARTSRQPGEDQESSGQFGEDVDLGREAGQGGGPEGKRDQFRVATAPHVATRGSTADLDQTKRDVQGHLHSILVIRRGRLVCITGIDVVYECVKFTVKV
ncbi:hypothetical protein Q7C36_013386 [Tachysurus vachellii]|uniref:Uncharacterized protein n=1 Tax=Tachysurus vachellii TaxID=175792 RepID=A0AA88MKL4_TACVA|nr:hypothetical protein Q7C36_013386 [Tachysurus vachellii]